MKAVPIPSFMNQHPKQTFYLSKQKNLAMGSASYINSPNNPYATPKAE